MNQPLTIAGRAFRSRLILGTGKFSSPEAMRDALDASGAELVTVALRRADLSGKKDPFANMLEFIDPKRFLVLPNTSGAMNAEEAVRLARLAVAAVGYGDGYPRNLGSGSPVLVNGVLYIMTKNHLFAIKDGVQGKPVQAEQ